MQLRTVVAENLPDDHSHQNIEKIFNVIGRWRHILLFDFFYMAYNCRLIECICLFSVSKQLEYVNHRSPILRGLKAILSWVTRYEEPYLTIFFRFSVCADWCSLVPFFLPFLLKLHALIEYEKTEAAERAVNIFILSRLLFLDFFFTFLILQHLLNLSRPRN